MIEDGLRRTSIERELASSAHLAKRHVHPRLATMLELGGMNTVFARGSGAHLWDRGGNRYLDFVAGGGVHFVGRNHPHVLERVREALGDELPNLCVVNASILGGRVAERLLAKAPGLGKVVFANSGSEAVDLALRFARYATGRRRFLHFPGSFHGRTWGAISVNGWPEMKQGAAPLLPECTAVPLHDLGALRRELARGDVAALIVEPLQGMTLERLEADFLRDAAALCKRHGTHFIADEIQTGLGRCGAWFSSIEAGVRPDLLTVSKTLSGGLVPVSAVLVAEDVYRRVYDRFKSGPFYFSTFGENNLAMAASLAVLDTLDALDAPTRARALGARIERGVAALASRHDTIDRVTGAGLMLGIHFKTSKRFGLALQQNALSALGEKGAFGAAVNVDLYARRRVLVQIPGPGLDAIKILPPVVATEADVDAFLAALDATLTSFAAESGPVLSLSRGVAQHVARTIAPEREPDEPRASTDHDTAGAAQRARSWTHTVRIDAPRARLLCALTEDIETIAAKMSPPCRVEVVRSAPRGVGKLTLETTWHVAELVPPHVRPLLLGGRITWNDVSEWDLEAARCEWRSTVELALGTVHLSGVEHYDVLDAGATLFRNACTARVGTRIRPSPLGAAATTIVASILPRLMRSNVDDLLAVAARHVAS